MFRQHGVKCSFCYCSRSPSIAVVAAVILVSGPVSWVAGSPPPSYSHNGQFRFTTDPPTAVRGEWLYDLDTRTTNPGVTNNQKLKDTVFVGVPSADLKSLDPPLTTANRSTASAYADYSLGSVPAPGGKITFVGEVHVDGVADANAKYIGTSLSSSVSWLKLQTRARGNAGWVTRAGARATGLANDTVTGRAMGKDPIDYEVLNTATGQAITGSMLSIPWAVEDGEWSWENDHFTMDAWTGEFHISLGSPYITRAGTLDLVIAQGKVATANDDGIFDGLLSSYPVGTVGPVNFTLPSAIEFDWDFSSIAKQLNARESDLEYSLIAYNQGLSEEVETPEPAALLVICTAGVFARRQRKST